MKSSDATMKVALMAATIVLTFTALSCGKKSGSVQLSFTSHGEGAVVSSVLPLTMKGSITDYDKLDKDLKEDLHVYLIEQSTKEKIWHIEPEGTIDAQGNWSAITWLGNRYQGNRNIFNVCVFVTDESLKLNDGDHPVKEKPSSLGEACITLKRRDR